MSVLEITFAADSEAVKKVQDSHPAFDRLIKGIGEYTLVLRSDYYGALVRSIVGQQLSARVAEVIWSRVAALCGPGLLKPENIMSLPDDTLKGAGLSRSKIIYIRELSRGVLSGTLDFSAFDSMSDGEVIDSLCAVKGIGRWTAEMFLIFSLGRPDVWALDDGGLRRALTWLLEYTEPISKADMSAFGEKIQPYRTIAALYLWEVINRDMMKPR